MAAIRKLRKELTQLLQLDVLCVWNPYMSKDCEKLEKVQQRAARWIGARWDSKMNRWSRPAQEI